MKIMIAIWHPAHVHFFKNMIWNLENRGHEILIVTREKDVTLNLLDAYGFEYKNMGMYYKKTLSKGLGILKIDYSLYKIARKFKPDLLTGIMGSYTAHIGKLIGKPSIIFSDTEYVKIYNWITFPFADVICTPSCFKKELNAKKHVKFNGYFELAYLHPKYFKPDRKVLEDLKLAKDDKFIVLRFVFRGAAHDVGLKGIRSGSEIDFINSLEEYGRVFITSERKLDRNLEKYRITTPPEKMHSLLNFAQLYIGEGSTMATEAAILGTPSIHIESAKSEKPSAASIFCGNFIELRDKYGLVDMFTNQDQALEKAISILEDKNSKKEWQRKKEKLLREKIDVTAWMTDFFENYPESFYEYKNKQV